MNRRQRRAKLKADRRAERRARQRMTREVPHAPTRTLIALAGDALDAAWRREGRQPLAALALNDQATGLSSVQIMRPDELLAYLQDLAPGLVPEAMATERARRLASAGAFICAWPFDGPPAWLLFGTPGRFLLEEGLEPLVELAREERPIAVGAEA